MDRLTEKQQQLLSGYVDGTLPVEQQRLVEAELQNSMAMREHLLLLKLIGETLTGSRPDPLSKNFTEKVMVNLQEYPLAAAPTSLRNGILLLIGVLITVGVSLVLVVNGVFDNAVTALDPSDFEMTKRFIKNPLPTVWLSGRVLVNGVIILNLALAWLVLDRTILKPLFQRRMRVE